MAIVLNFLIVALVAASAVNAASEGKKYKETGPCKDNVKFHYKYQANEEYFDQDVSQTFNLTVRLDVTCLSVGSYEGTKAVLFDMKISDVMFGGDVMKNQEYPREDFKARFAANDFEFVQLADGKIPATYHPRDEDAEIVNFKKSITSVFVANFEGTKSRVEADVGSIHRSTYYYFTSIQDMEEGKLTMERRTNSQDVVAYAENVPTDEINMTKVEKATFQHGVLDKASGTIECRLMPKKNVKPEDEIEEDNLESIPVRTKRDEPNDPDKIKSYDPSIVTNKYDSKGSFKMVKVGTSRLRRREVRELKSNPQLVESTLLGYINQTRRSLEKMSELRHDLGDIHNVLVKLERQSNNTALAQKVETLLKLEFKYGPPSGMTPTIDVVLEYLDQLYSSKDEADVQMRIVLYFLISSEGSLRSQMALLKGLEKAVDDNEMESVHLYIALVANPQPQFVAKLETFISPDVHSNDPLLLVYGAIIPRASTELKERMTIFLIDRLEGAEEDSSSLIHHILSLGNAASNKSIESLTGYLYNPDTDVQLVSIFAMRFVMNNPSIIKSIKQYITQPDVTEDHVAMVAKALMYGTERAKLNREPKPYSQDLAESLVLLTVGTHNEELYTALTSYLTLVNTPDSISLLKLLKHATKVAMSQDYSNSTRFRRGTQWDDSSDAVYNLVAPLSERQSDVRTYQHRLSYIWGKQFGGGDINAQVAVGGLAGVANSGSYKLFGHAVAKANCYDRSLTIIEFLILRQKDATKTQSRVYSVVMGITVVNINQIEDASVCINREKQLYEGKQYTVFDFTYSVFVVVGTLNFGLKATIQFSAGMYVEACENHGSVTARAGLSPTLTIVVAASGDLEIVWVAKAGLTLEATFNYKVLPEVNSEICYKNGVIRVKNCLGVYHMWTDNTLELYAWYAWRGWCGWWACTGSDAYKDKKKISGLSISWDLPGTDKLKIWELCDAEHTC